MYVDVEPFEPYGEKTDIVQFYAGCLGYTIQTAIHSRAISTIPLSHREYRPCSVRSEQDLFLFPEKSVQFI